MNRQRRPFGSLLIQAAIVAACALAHIAGPAAAQGASQPAKPPLKLVALGDSLTAGYGLGEVFAFPSVLNEKLRRRGHAVEIANAGVSGDTASGGLDRLDWSVPDGTHGVILELGANDMLRGIDPAVTRKALEGIVTRLKERGIPVMLAGMYASRNLGEDYVKRFESIYTDLAKEHDLVLYPFFLEGIAGEAKLLLPDGLHPNAKGVETIVDNIVSTVETFLARLPAKG